MVSNRQTVIPSMWSTRIRWYNVSFRSCKSSSWIFFWISDLVALSSKRKRSICILMLLRRAGRSPLKRRRSRSSDLNAVPLLKKGLCKISGPRTPIVIGAMKSRRQPSHSQPVALCLPSTEFQGSSSSLFLDGRGEVELMKTRCELCQEAEVFLLIAVVDTSPWIRCREARRRRDTMELYMAVVRFHDMARVIVPGIKEQNTISATCYRVLQYSIWYLVSLNFWPSLCFKIMHDFQFGRSKYHWHFLPIFFV